MSTKKRLVKIGFILVAAGLAIRIWGVNQSQLVIPEQHASMTETVELDGDFIFDDQENTQGYSVCVEDAKIMDASEYLDRYGKAFWDASRISGGPSGDVLVLTYNVANEGNDSGWLDMAMLMAVGASKNTLYKVDGDLWEVSEPSLANSSALVLEPDSTYTTHIPFSLIEEPGLFKEMLDQSQYRRRPILDKAFTLYVANAPTRRAIDIGL